jgi:hypothetical protein
MEEENNINYTINNVNIEEPKKPILPPEPPKFKDTPKPNNKDNLLNDKEIEPLIQKAFIEYDKIKIKISRIYMVVPIIITLLIIGFMALWYFHAHPFLIILYIFLVIPVISLVFFIFLWRAYKDKHRIKATLIKAITNHFIIATFFYENHRIKRRMFRTARDFFGFENGDYYMDTRSVWLDDENYINLFYFAGIPNPLLFNFKTWISKFFINKNSNPPTITKDENGNEIEVSYSSESIKLFRKDKLLQELHKGNGLTIFEILLLVGVLIIIVLEIVNLTSGSGVPQQVVKGI